MATIVNNPAPAPTADSSNGMGFFLGIILVIIVAVLFFYYGLPAIRSVSQPQITVPGKIDVNVNTPNK